MGELELAVALPVYVVSVGATLFYTAVTWRIFNKARRSGILLAWGLIQTATWPWASEVDPWVILAVVGVSLLVSIGITFTWVSIIGRPGWWTLPVFLIGVPQLVLVIWGMQASVYETTPDALITGVLIAMVIGFLMGIPLYLVGMYELGDAFGYGTGFRIGLMFLPPIFLPILAFGSGRYGDWGRAERERQMARTFVSPQQGPPPSAWNTTPGPPQ